MLFVTVNHVLINYESVLITFECMLFHFDKFIGLNSDGVEANLLKLANVSNKKVLNLLVLS